MKSLNNLKLPKKLSANNDASPDPDWSGAVVFLFVKDRVLLIKRSETMPSHRGQIAFVGGHKVEGESPWETAKREFEEETSLSSSDLRLVGFLDIVRTTSRSCIVPVVCFFDEEPEKFVTSLKSNGEWSEAMLVPFEDLLKSSRWTFAKSILPDSEHLIKFYPIMRNSYISNSGDNGKDHLLWGATAKMIWNFFKFYGEDAN